MRTNWLRSGAVAGVLAFLLFVSINIVADRLFSSARLDMTQEGLFTLSEGTEEVLEGLNERVSITFYFSERAAANNPRLFAYGRRVEDLLREYRALAGSKIDLKVVDPRPFTQAEDEAAAAGIRPIGGLGDGAPLYLGLVAEDSTDQEEVIEFLSPDREQFLEYDLTKLIYTLDAKALPKLAILTTLPLEGAPGNPLMGGGGTPPQIVYEQLAELFDVTMLDPGFDALPVDTDVLLLAHPPALSDRQRYLIDQYVLGGGHAALFLDPQSEASLAAGGPMAGMGGDMPDHSGLPDLLAAWGVEMTEDKLVGDLAYSQRVDFGGGGFRQTKDYVLWLAVTDDSIDPRDPVTGPVNALNFATAGALSPIDGATTAFRPLVQSSRASALMDIPANLAQPDADALMRALDPDDRVYTLAARVSGPARTAFADGPVAPEPAPADAADGADTAAGDTEAGDERSEPAADDAGQSDPGEGDAGEAASDDAASPDAQAESVPATEIQAAHHTEGDINIIVVADADLMDDRFWVRVQNIFGQRVAQPIADNGTFVINALENLSGSKALMSLRGRGVSQRPFSVVEEMRRDAEARYLEQEQRLQARLEETERRLAELQGQTPDDQLLLSPEQEAAIERFRQERLAVRQDLRDVERNLRSDIERLGNLLAFLNIAAVPMLVVLGVGVLVIWRRKRGARP
ncbi:hypothetical protein CCR85_06525 [Rhodothalassium salexigens]|uniref:GldG family protein n=1 Tax=Rhodothalassium salexigens TaxID=1086 RepID=UPI001914D48B|nr:Gldg family protein [Rhodothalassium salexigens]MBK5911145.1 hypothetical protein [Rhodothalassium salexigens]